MSDRLTALDEIQSIREALTDAGFDVYAVHGQQLNYQAPGGDLFKVVVTKYRNR
ncbi:hypothetical protein [Nocardia sp. CC227C]|uniref:hypothetical protein n=1 Tax=Nocardia sp. CC227C TaxID=3044562 RepID=UPI00278BB86D|nr:hypothetical protein [Nocardia sp. CC227C]